MGEILLNATVQAGRGDTIHEYVIIYKVCTRVQDVCITARVRMYSYLCEITV